VATVRTPLLGARRPAQQTGTRRLTTLFVVGTLVGGGSGLPAAQARTLAPLSPTSADGMREAIRDAVKADIDAGNFSAAAVGLAENAALLGDPITFIEAGEMHLKQAEQDRDISECEAAIAATEIGLDILYFFNDVAAGKNTTTWLAIDPVRSTKMIPLAEAQRDEALALIETIEAEQKAAAQVVAPAPEPVVDEPKRRPIRPGTGLLIGGAFGTTVGIAGVSLAIAGVVIGNGKQGEIDDLMSPADDDAIGGLDDESKDANRLAIIGAAVAATGLGVGVPLLIVGLRKRRDSAPAEKASVQLGPMLSGGARGLALAGRF